MAIQIHDEDLKGNDPDHFVSLEKRSFNSKQGSRVIVPSYGAFYQKSLRVIDAQTRKPLTVNVDYKLAGLDEDLTLRSGQAVYLAFVVLNPNINAVEYLYQFVGGTGGNGKYLIEKLEALYPNGIETIWHWDYIKGRPEEYVGKKHKQSIQDTYGWDGFNNQLRRIVNVFNAKDKNAHGIIYLQAGAIISAAENQTDQDLVAMRNQLHTITELVKVQEGEYIITDSLTNPGLVRKYGNWVQIKNRVLKGADSDATVGDGTVLASGYTQPLLNAYIWQNTSNATVPTYRLNTTQPLLNAVVQTDEEKDFTITLQTTGLATGAKVSWVLTGQDAQYLTFNKGGPSGTFIVDNEGKASVTLNIKNQAQQLGTRNIEFRLEHVVDVYFPIAINDTVRARWVEAYFCHDIQGNIRATRVSEGSTIYLRLIPHGYNVGETIYLDWTHGNLTEYDFEIKPPSFTSATTSPLSIALKLKANQLTDGERTLIVYVKDGPSYDVDNTTPMAYVMVEDTSTGNIVYVEYRRESQLVTAIDEGVNFDIYLRSSYPQGTQLDVVYTSTKDLSEFEGLSSTVVVGSNGAAIINAGHIEDFSMAQGAQILKTEVRYQGSVAGSGVLVIRDTSQAPAYQVKITRPNSTAAISKINEGEEFWVRVSVANYVAGSRFPKFQPIYTMNGIEGANGKEARVDSPFHTLLEFSSASDVYDDVIWNNGELILKMAAIADNQFGGDVDFGVGVKNANGGSIIASAQVKIMDTSVLKISTTWSSSAVVLEPVTQVNEMQSNGQDNTFYLWLDTTGDGSKFKNITLRVEGGGITAADLVTVFPTNVAFDNGSSRRIVSITAKADFINDGNKTLTVVGTYIDTNGDVKEIIRSSVVLIDNSVLVPVSVKLSNSATDPNSRPAGGFSEYESIYAHITSSAFAIQTKYKFELKLSNGTPLEYGFTRFVGGGDLFVNQDTYVLELKPSADRTIRGQIDGYVEITRTLSSGVAISASERAAFLLLDDSVPPSTRIVFYTDSSRTTEMGGTTYNEGDVMYGRAFFGNPNQDVYCMVNINRNSDGMEGNVRVMGANGQLFNYANQRKVLATYPVVNRNVTYTIDFEIPILRDRKTAVYSQRVYVGAVMMPNPNGVMRVGDVASTIDTGAVSSYYLARGINDTSKDSSFNIYAALTPNGAVVSNVDEGATFYVVLQVDGGEIGDTYTITKANDFDASRFEVNNLGQDQVQSVYNDQLAWQFKVKIDRQTNTNNTITFAVTNKSTGVSVATLNVNINDIYRQPTLDMRFTALDNYNAPLSKLREGDGAVSLWITSDEYLRTDESIMINVASDGRVAGDFEGSGSIGQWLPVVAINGRYGVKINGLYPKANKTTNSGNELVAKFNAKTSITNALSSVSLPIEDVSRTRSYRSVGWYLAGGNSPISSANEGDTVELRVQAYGGEESIPVKVSNNAGRNAALMDSQEYGVVKNRSSDDQWLTWTFKIKADFTNNSGDDLRLRVDVELDGNGSLTRTETLPINDTSTNSQGAVAFKNTGGGAISNIDEGSAFVVSFELSNWNTNSSYRCVTKSARTGESNTWQLDDVSNVSSWSDSGGRKQKQFSLSTQRNNKTDSAEGLQITAELWEVQSNRQLGSGSLTLIDVSREGVPESAIAITAVGGTSHLSQVNEGNTVGLYFAPLAFNGTNWQNSFYKWKLYRTSGEVLASGEIKQNNLAGDGSYSTTYAIAADEVSNGNRTIKLDLDEAFYASGTVSNRGKSADTTVIDTSPLPSIDAVFISKNSTVGNDSTQIESANEGETIYVHVWATGLTADGSDTTVQLEYGGTSDAADFDSRPTTVTMKLVDAGTRKYKGVSAGLPIRNDGVEG